MAVAAQRTPTFDELYAAVCALPEGVTGEILEDGRIDTMGRPGRAHTRAAMRLTRLLGTVEDDEERDGWVFAIEREIRLLDTRLVVPDLAAWRVIAGDDAFLDENPVLWRPDWVCEILSASTERRDRAEKLPLYARAGVPHVWIVDPDARFVEVYETRGGAPTQVCVARAEEAIALPPFEALVVPLAALWGPRREG